MHGELDPGSVLKQPKNGMRRSLSVELDWQGSEIFNG